MPQPARHASTSTGLGLLFADTYPDRCLGLAIVDPRIRGTRAPDYPWAPTPEEWRRQLAEVRAGAVEDPVVQGALRVSVGLGAMVDTWERAPGQVLARLHVLAATDLAGPADLGRPHGQAGPRLTGLFSVITGATSVPAVVIAGVVHGELAAEAAATATADGAPRRSRCPSAGRAGRARARAVGRASRSRAVTPLRRPPPP